MNRRLCRKAKAEKAELSLGRQSKMQKTQQTAVGAAANSIPASSFPKTTLVKRRCCFNCPHGCSAAAGYSVQHRHVTSPGWAGRCWHVHTSNSRSTCPSDTSHFLVPTEGRSVANLTPPHVLVVVDRLMALADALRQLRGVLPRAVPAAGTVTHVVGGVSQPCT